MNPHLQFDEAHTSVPAALAPLAAEALQRLRYYNCKQWLDSDLREEIEQDKNQTLLLEKITSTAIIPSQATEHSIGYDLHSNNDDTIIPPQSTTIINTGISLKPPIGTYICITPRSGLTVHNNITTLAGIIDPDYHGEIKVILSNFGSTPHHILQGDKIAQIIVEHASTPNITVTDNLPTTSRGRCGFGSTDPYLLLKKTINQPSLIHLQ